MANEEKIVIVENVPVAASDTKTSFLTKGALAGETPMWAKMVFRIVAVLTTVALFIVAGDPGIHDDIKVRIAVYLKGLDMAVLGVSKLFGITTKE